MSGRIPQTFIDDILARTDLVELINSRVPLKKAGTNHKACCPFHQEKTASFNVNGNKQFYHCFGCGASGNAISFMMEFDRLDFPDAIEELAGRLGMEVPRDASSVPNVSKSLYEIMQQSSDFYAGQLSRSQTAREYLNQRGLNKAVADQYHIGFAPDAWNDLMNHIGRDKEQIEQLIDVGMVVKNDKGKTYDRFRNRLMFPIRNKRGKVIAFGGRIIGDGQPKYLNSPETPIFSKGRELYGLYEAKQANRELKRLLIVEGYMDVVALAQFGINYAVATLGTATTDNHLKELFKQVNEIVFCFDGDKAGRDAAWKALDLSLSHIRGDRLVKFMFLPQGEDPDSRVRAIGQEAFEDELNNSYSLSSYLLEALTEDQDLTTADSKSSYIGRLQPYLDKITHPIYLDMVLDEAAEKLGLNTEQLSKRLKPEIPAVQTRRPVSSASHVKAITPMRMMIASLVQKPSLAAEVTSIDWIDLIEQPGSKLLKQLLDLLHQNPHLTTGSLMEHWREKPEYNQLVTLASWDLMMEDDDRHTEVFRDSISKLFVELGQKRLDSLVAKQKNSQLTESEKQELRQLLSINK